MSQRCNLSQVEVDHRCTFLSACINIIPKLLRSAEIRIYSEEVMKVIPSRQKDLEIARNKTYCLPHTLLRSRATVWELLVYNVIDSFPRPTTFYSYGRRPHTY